MVGFMGCDCIDGFFYEKKILWSHYFFLIPVVGFQCSLFDSFCCRGFPNCSDTAGVRLSALLSLFSQIATEKLQRSVGELRFA